MKSRSVFSDVEAGDCVDMLTAEIEREAHALAVQARESGLVLTIVQVSVPPWETGRHIDIVTIRPARKLGGSYWWGGS